MSMQQTLLDNRYEISHKIGEGGMAAVYCGHDRRLSRRVAIKILHSHYASDQDFLRRFQHEAQAAARLSHPNVVNVYDVGEDGNTHYIVMEYVEGENLKTLINRAAPLPVEQAVAIAAAVARGLEAAHRFGLIHRDIKPQNIMVEPDGHVRITDFGIAKSNFSTALTETGITFGTADYISPEQARGKTATPRSDIYALGITLFEMLTGRLPFSADNAVAVAMQHVSDPPPLLRQLNPQVPPQLETLVLQALAKDAHQRPSSAYEFAQLLNNYRRVAAQDTVITPNMDLPVEAPRIRPPAPPFSGNGNTTSRRQTVPPRPVAARAPQQDGHGCGVFVLGFLLLLGVLGFVLMFNTGTFNGLFASSGNPGQIPSRTTATAQTATITTTATVTTTTTPTPTPTATTTPTPTRALVRVPDVRNLPEAAAIAQLEAAGLTAVAGTPRNSDTVAQGRIIEQSVTAGSQIEAGRSVTYTVSQGSRFVSLPDFGQRRIESARSEAESLGLNVDTREEPSTSFTEGIIIRQVPNPGARLLPGDTLTLVVSVGDQIRMPELTGRSEEEAKAVLANTAGLTWVYTDPQGRGDLENFDSYRPGEVVSAAFADGRAVRGGQWVPRGSEIVLGVRAP